MYDVLVIGAGVVGCSIARELSRYRLKIALLEAEPDIACGSSKANSGIVHAGYDAKPGTLMARLNVAGNAMFGQLSKELDFQYKNIGSLVLAFTEEEITTLRKLKARGEANGVTGLKILEGDDVRKMEPNVSEKCLAALYAPTGGVTCPYGMTIALCENAVSNGVELFREQEVQKITKQNGCFEVVASKSSFQARYVINCAGAYADVVSRMAGAEQFEIDPRRGEYCILDKKCGNLLNHVIFQTPSELGKGVLISPTADGNIIVGPNAYHIDDKENKETTYDGLQEVLIVARRSVENIPIRDNITNFSGIRAVFGEDFRIGESDLVKGFYQVAGICSPGLTSAPAIGKMVAEELFALDGGFAPNPDFNPTRKAICRYSELNTAEKKRMIEINPLYGRIICRCETVTEAEVVEAIRRPAGARTVDGVKRRVRAGMGRCQGGFCSPRVVELLSRELGIQMTEVEKDTKDSYLLTGMTR